MKRSGADELFYTTHGSGPPLLVMHGGLGWDHTYFRPWLDALGDDVELNYYDHRGNGRSGRPDDWDAVSHETWVEDADALREDLGYDRIVLLGHSYGGFLALEYALAYPERLKGLILVDTAPALDYTDVALAKAQARSTPEQFEALVAGLSGPSPDDETFERLSETIFPIYFHRLGGDDVQRVFADTIYSSGALNRSMFGCAASYNVLDRLGEIDVPTLILGGRHDWITPPEHGAERLHAGIPHSELVIFEESGHFPFIEEADAFADAVRAWLGRLFHGT